MKGKKKFYIGQRHNPQFKEPYYKEYGQLSKAEAKKKENCLYGSMYLTSFETKEEYENVVAKMKSEGKRFI